MNFESNFFPFPCKLDMLCIFLLPYSPPCPCCCCCELTSTSVFAHFAARKFFVREIFPLRRCNKRRLRETRYFSRHLIAPSTKVFLQNCLCSISNPPLLHRLLAFYLLGQLQLGSMASSLDLILLTQVCPRAL